MAALAASKSQALRERMELIKEMKASPWHMKEGECDWTPPLDLLGVYTAFATVARMVHNDELDPTAALYLNAALSLNAFGPAHHATHESISQHDPEHAKLENTVFRLGVAMLFVLDDGYREAHRLHHIHLGTEMDPDRFTEKAPLSTFGHAILNVAVTPNYCAGGGPITPFRIWLMKQLGITRWALTSFIARRFFTNWDNVVLKMAGIEARKLIQERKEFAKLHQTVQASWTGAVTLGTVIGTLMFSRYVHRHTPDVDEIDSYYQTTFRGQGEVDLWMMGEGPHHLHHAKPDVSYALLPKISMDLEERRPDLMAKMRGTTSIERLEYAQGPQKVVMEEAKLLDPAKDAPSMQFPWLRTEAVRAGKVLLETDVAAGMEKIATAVLDSAFHVCTTADVGLLRKLSEDMGTADIEEDPTHPAPIKSWSTSVLTEATVQKLHAARERVRSEVSAVARGLGERVRVASGPIRSDDDLKARYLDFFVALCDTLLPADDQRAFAEAFASHIFPGGKPQAAGETREEMIKRLRQHLESDVPSNFSPGRKAAGGNEAKTRQRVKEIFFGSAAAMSKL